MIYIVSRAQLNDKRRVCHKQGCPYEKRIKMGNKMTMGATQVEQCKFGECEYCSGLRGDVRVYKNKMLRWEESTGIRFRYRPESNELFLWTSIGFWKVSENRYGAYLLWHKNSYFSGTSFEKARKGKFHRQSDVDETYSLEKIIVYVVEHDKAKAIMQKDYRGLPRSTKKQKQYYKMAKKRQTKRDIRRMDYLFKMIEKDRSSC